MVLVCCGQSQIAYVLYSPGFDICKGPECPKINTYIKQQVSKAPLANGAYLFATLAGIKSSFQFEHCLQRDLKGCDVLA